MPCLQFKIKKHLPWVVFVLAVVHFVIAWLWRPPFIWGDRSGPYWLFVVLDWTVLLLTVVSFLAFLGASAVWLVRLIRQEPSVRSAALTGGLLLLASLIFFGASFPTLISPIEPLDSLSARGRVYYLAGIGALTDNNYALFECDRVGLLCWQVYRSGDYSLAEPMQANLTYDAATNTLTVEVGGHGTVYTHHP